MHRLGAATIVCALPRKSRTPPPPKRPVQAPKVRTDPRRTRRGNRRVLIIVATLALVLIAVVVGFLVFARGGGGGNTNVIETLKEAGCSYKNPKSQGRQHVNAVPAGYKPNSKPRSSGPHSLNTIIYGTYSEPVPELNAVHNLEHGAIIIWYGPKVPESTVTEINDVYNDDPRGLIVSPYPKLGNQIALVGWTRVARCNRFDAGVAKAFIQAFRGKGPEKFPMSSLEPGSP